MSFNLFVNGVFYNNNQYLFKLEIILITMLSFCFKKFPKIRFSIKIKIKIKIRTKSLQVLLNKDSFLKTNLHYKRQN